MSKSPIEQPKTLSLAARREFSDLNEALERSSADLLNDLRFAWDLPEHKPIRVVGRISVKALGDGREIWLLDDIEHPEKGVGLLYPTLSNSSDSKDAVAASAFVPPGPSRKVVEAKIAASGGQWGLAELELSPFSERQKRRNPWLMNVRSGTLRLLSEVPSDWQIMVAGPQSARRISTLARDEVENYLRKLIIDEDQELANRLVENDKARGKLETARRQAEVDAMEAHAEIEAKLVSHRKHSDDAERSAKQLQAELGAEQKRFHSYQQKAKLEKQTMEMAYRRLEDLLSEKGDRLIALGLADAEDVSALLPHLDAMADTRGGISFVDALPGGFAELAPWLQTRMADQDLLYSQAQLRDFLALLLTRDLVVLAGDSGSGKTSLVRAAATAIGGVCTVIPVKPNWTGPEDLLGYFNPIERSYQATPFLLALQTAALNPQVPHFICLDEMNLARVEHYFADFLSLLENRSKAPTIELYTADEERHVVVEQGIFLELEAEARRRSGLGDGATLEEVLRDDRANSELHRLGGFADKESVLRHHSRLRRSLSAQMRMPTSMTLPENVWIFGAVNMDETTHQLSPKVLDRVHVVRFRNPMLSDWNAIEAEAQEAKQAQPSELPSLNLCPADFGTRCEYPAFDRHDADVTFLSHLSREYLDPLGVEFGLRAIRQSQGYLVAAKVAGISNHEALDNVIKHKILPKFAFDTVRPAGNGRPRRELLNELHAELAQRFEVASFNLEASCVSELGRMIRLAEGNNGIVNYWLR
jgi:hypothetical protein